MLPDANIVCTLSDFMRAFGLPMCDSDQAFVVRLLPSCIKICLADVAVEVVLNFLSWTS